MRLCTTKALDLCSIFKFAQPEINCKEPISAEMSLCDSSRIKQNNIVVAAWEEKWAKVLLTVWEHTSRLWEFPPVDLIFHHVCPVKEAVVEVEV